MKTTSHHADGDLLPLIKEITDERPTYGYPRVTAVLNRKRREAGEHPVNHKRVYRIMRENNLCLSRHTGRSYRTTHDGQVITMKSDLRWCSDIFGIRCWNGDFVWVIFSMDCHDREVIRWAASSVGVNGELVRDLVAETFEQRFPLEKLAPQRLEWLTDNGPQYTAHETIQFVRSLGLTVCTTPAYSPESNGMAEAFVKTFKRDYVYVNELKDAVTVMEKLPEWFKDYNEVAPHRGLKMMAPKQYRELNQTAG
jgi:transposase InsO family protein